jgi:hypothetical protein
MIIFVIYSCSFCIYVCIVLEACSCIVLKVARTEGIIRGQSVIESCAHFASDHEKQPPDSSRAAEM